MESPVSQHAALHSPSTPKKSPRARVRVSRACDYCKSKKIRCTGKQPCPKCVQEDIVCEFKAPYARGKRRPRPSLGIPPESPSLSPYPLSTPQTIGDTQSENHGHGSSSLVIGSDSCEGRDQGNEGSPEPGESDRQGHFVGASSGLSFLLRLQRRLRENSGGSTETSVFALGDPVLPQFDNTAVILPPKEKADNLLKTYFELSSPTYRFLHRPTVESWLEELYQNGMVSAPHSRSKYAVIMTMFAQSIQYIEPQGTSGISNGMLYFQSAEQELNRETEPATLTSVQALLGCCFYIMTQSRLNHCWSLFGTTSRLVLALGMHRKKFNLDGIASSTACPVESECRKRTFWCAYNLDRYLSAIFGRPCAFHDDDIDQEVPALIEDDALSSTHVDATRRRGMNIMLGPLAHQQLARILSRILRQLYGINLLGDTARYDTMARLGAEIQNWRDELPAFLNPDKVDSRILQPIYQRQSNTLSLAAGHCLILIYRPCLFNDYTKSRHDEETKENVKRCVDAALSVVTIIDYMVESKQLYPSLWFAPYQAFCAVVVLYTYTIRNYKDNQTPWKEHFEAAERCQRLLFGITSPSSLGRRLSVIMEEYRLEVINQVQQSSHLHTSKSMSLAEAALEPGASSWLESIGNEDNLLELMDLPNWEQLDSLVLDLGRIIPELDFMGTNAGFCN